jgi:diguanylate cyclase (GGDEF)-like protein
MDNLKYINDKHGHSEGDEYIINVAKSLQKFSNDAVVCRLGGDEFMLLVQDIKHDEAHIRMNDICTMIQNDEYLKGKEYFYSVSFGVIYVDENNTLTESEILSIADERMYEHKKARKRNRQT